MTKAVDIRKPLMPVKRRRVWELDFLRGIAVLAMCFDHMMYDFSHLSNFFSNYYEVESAFMSKIAEFAKSYWASGAAADPGFRFWAHYIFVFLFLFLVGTSCAFSRDNTKRGSLLAVVALGFTGITFILRIFGIMTHGVVFGILDCIAMCILCAAAIDNLTKRFRLLNILAPLVIGVVILAVGISSQFWLMSLKYDRVFNWDNLIKYIIGTRAYGDDWFGLFPYVGVVLLGMYWGKAVYAERKSILPILDGKWNKPFAFVGRHALLFYILHQVVIAGLVIVIGLSIGYSLGF